MIPAPPSRTVIVMIHHGIYGHVVAQVRDRTTREVLFTAAYTPADYTARRGQAALIRRARRFAERHGWTVTESD